MVQEAAGGETSPHRAARWAQLNAEIVVCTACPRLVAYRQEVARTKRRAFRDWDYWGRPVPGFGDPQAQVVIIGLAPGAHGANRTGRMFTGDSSGQTLMAALHCAGFADQPTSEHRDDGLALQGVFLTAVVRCVPPQNRPTAEERANCRPFLARELALRVPGRRIAFAHSPPFAPLSAEEDEKLTAAIVDSGARVLFVGLGCPKQELWMAGHVAGLRPIQVGVGAAFDFIAGAKSQAPRWVQRGPTGWPASGRGRRRGW